MTESAPYQIVETADGSLTVSHPEHGECYHSHLGALREARELYLRASGIETIWNRTAPGSSPISVLDVGLGLGYNAVTTIASWHRAPAPPNLQVQSLEIDPALAEALASGQAPWQRNWPDAELLTASSLRQTSEGLWRATLHHPRSGALCDWFVDLGDARRTSPLPRDGHLWDFVWQDPFSPEKNPDMWSPEWFRQVRAGARPGCVLMTYSVARRVRDALAAADWRFEKILTSTGVKKHWLRATPAGAEAVSTT